MAEFGNLRHKYCACCSTRLDYINKRRNIRRVNTNDLLNTLNIVKPIILQDKRKNIDTDVKLNDLICGKCRNYANRYGQNYVNLNASSSSQ
jgi:hypothetical protein